MKIFDNDPVWDQATSAWRQAKAAFVAAEKELNAALELLERMAPAGGQGNGLTLSRIITDGRVSYKAALDALCPNADVEAWRGQGTVTYRVVDSLSPKKDKSK